MSTIRSVCVYCGSGPGTDPAYVEAAEQFGRTLAENGVRVIYGGGKIGLMGAVSAAAIKAGGEVTGIIPEFLVAREHARGNGLIVTRDMHERKRKMFEMADAFVALPGGVGTLEEIVEQITWAQLGRHKKPVLLASIGGFWAPLCALFEHMKTLQFIRPGLDFELLVADKVDDILPMLEKAAADVSEHDKKMKTVEPERL
jgi:uncharacterized protein (TIGR00730 family)